MDGTALVRAVRAQGDGRYSYVMVLTGVADEESARATMQAGADDLLLKPLEPAQLERKLIAAERVTAMHRRMHEDARHDAAAGLHDPTSGPDDIFELAEQALYRAKDGGRNRVEVHDAGEAQATGGVRLLIADDDPMIRLTLSALIERESGFELVGTAEDADQAIEMAARRRPDVVLLDFSMPGGGGVRAAMQIRDVNPNIKLVAVSADDSQAAQYEMSRAGAVGYVIKGSPDEQI